MQCAKREKYALLNASRFELPLIDQIDRSSRSIELVTCFGYGMVFNKSNRTTMRPLGIYLIGISIYILNMIHFLMILVDFGVFSLMVTDGRTDGHTLL